MTTETKPFNDPEPLQREKSRLAHILRNNTNEKKSLVLAISVEDQAKLAELPFDDFLELYIGALEESVIKKREYFSEMSPAAFDRHGFSFIKEQVTRVGTLSPEQQQKVGRLCELMVRTRIRQGKLFELKEKIQREKDSIPPQLLALFEKALENFNDPKYDKVGLYAIIDTVYWPKTEELPQRTKSINTALAKLSPHLKHDAHGIAHGTVADQITQLNALALCKVDTTAGFINTSTLRLTAAGSAFGLGGGQYGPFDNGYFLLISGKDKLINQDGVRLIVVADELPQKIFESLKNDYKDILPLVRASELSDDTVEQYTS